MLLTSQRSTNNWKHLSSTEVITTQHYGKTRCFLGKDDHNVPPLTSGDRSLKPNKSLKCRIIYSIGSMAASSYRDVLLRHPTTWICTWTCSIFPLGNFGTMHIFLRETRLSLGFRRVCVPAAWPIGLRCSLI